MHQADTTVHIRLAIPGCEADAHGLHVGLSPFAPLQQVGQHQAGKVNVVIEHHALQVVDAQLGVALQAL